MKPILDDPILSIDRCDRCGANALVRVHMRTGGELLFCGHHYSAVEPVLVPQTSHIHDERKSLLV